MRERDGISNSQLSWAVGCFGNGPNELYSEQYRNDPWFHERRYGPAFIGNPSEKIEGLRASIEFSKTIRASKVRDIVRTLWMWHTILSETIGKIKSFNSAQEWERAQSEGML